MKTALDSSVILDVLTDDAVWGSASEVAINEAHTLGQLIIGECVIAEISPVFQAGSLEIFLEEWQIQFVPTSLAAAKSAGKMYGKYLQRRGSAKRVLPDFLIGSHALHCAGRLLARDRGYYRDYFSGLTLIQPVI